MRPAREGRYCAAHARERDKARGTREERGYDNVWRRTRGRYLKDHAYCENCGVTEAETGRPLNVGHIDGLGPNGPRGHDPANLQTLCEVCHGRKTAAETGLGGTP